MIKNSFIWLRNKILDHVSACNYLPDIEFIVQEKQRGSQEPFSQFCSESDMKKMKQRSILGQLIEVWQIVFNTAYKSWTEILGEPVLKRFTAVFFVKFPARF